jgi:NAD(P)H dehydrogenase (quinone)
VRAIYHICPNVSRDEVAYARAVATAARTHGVTRFVYHSVLHPQIEAMPHHWQKVRVEEMLLAAGFDLNRAAADGIHAEYSRRVGQHRSR